MSHEKPSNDRLLSKFKLKGQSKEATAVENEIEDGVLETTPPQSCAYFATCTVECRSYTEILKTLFWRNRGPGG
jgi:hypothetical protein